MAKFTYEAVTESGSKVKGNVEAESIEEARQLIAAKGYIPSRVSKGGGGGPGALTALDAKLGGVKVPELILFTKQFRTLFNAGLSIVNLLEVLEQQTTNKVLQAAVIEIQQDIKSGLSIYNAFRKHPRIFSVLYCSMLRAGEISGTLPDVLERLIYIIEHDYKIKKQIRSALIYPIIVLVALIGAFFFLLLGVIPTFVTIFEKADIDLPFPTKVCIALHKGITEYWMYLLGITVVVAVALIFYLRTDQGKMSKAKFILRMPLIGKVVQKGAMARFASIFSLLQSSGVSILETVGILADTIGNVAISSEFHNLRDKLQEGLGIAAPLRKSQYFTPMVINMIAIGEETGELDNMMREVAKHYDFEVEYAVQKMTEMIGPLLMGLLAAMVGFFAMAIFFPIFDLTKLVN
ncbi:MAG: type II secretion system F family protein [Desulfovibrio sp.]|nr:MAG: type II secretion system F family protein [Desulfovibrio sp.]